MDERVFSRSSSSVPEWVEMREPSVNRLVLGMLASALFLGSSLLLSRSVPPPWTTISVLATIGCVTSFALGLRLWRAISKSGHLDRRK